MRTGNNQLEFYKPSNTYLITQYLKISHGPRNKVETLIRYYTLFKIQDTHCKDKINIYIYIYIILTFDISRKMFVSHTIL